MRYTGRNTEVHAFENAVQHTTPKVPLYSKIMEQSDLAFVEVCACMQTDGYTAVNEPRTGASCVPS